MSGAERPARRVARAALSTAWPHVRDRLAQRTVPEHRLARQLARDAERARRAHLVAVQEHARAVARRERVLRRARATVPTWTTVSAVAAVATVPAEGGLSVALGTLAVAGSARVALAVRRLVRPPSVPPAPPALPAGPPPPHPRSAAFPAVVRLEQVRGALQSLLPLVPPAGRAVAEEAWQAAATADTALRWQAARIGAAEPHRGAEPALLAALEAGVAQQEALVQGVADLVAAGADPYGDGRLQDVTDRLHGLAAGLREVRGA